MNLTQNKKIAQILFDSFHGNKSANFTVKQDSKRDQRFTTLMEYSIFQGENFGKLWLSDDEKACAIVIDPTKKKTTWKGILWDLKLIFKCVGLRKVSSVMKREKKVKETHPNENTFLHLWYLGVDPQEQGKGKGTALLKAVISEAKNQGKSICLETSNPRNFPFYEANGFKETAVIEDFGFPIRAYKYSNK